MCILSLAGLTVSLLGSDVRYGSQAMSLGWILQHVACALDPNLSALLCLFLCFLFLVFLVREDALTTVGTAILGLKPLVNAILVKAVTAWQPS